MKNLPQLALVVAVSSCPALGCLDPTVIGGEGGGGGSTTAAVSTTTTGGPGAGTSTAWLGADVAPATFERVCTFPLQCRQEADVLYLFIDTQGSTCSLPLDPDTTVTAWEMVLGVPPSAQRVGLHTMDETFFIGGSRSEWHASTGATVAATGGMGFQGQGTLEILELDDTTVRFALTGVDGPADGAVLEASRCGSTTELAPEGVALVGDALDGGSAGGGAGVDGAGVTIVLGDTLASCEEPLLGTCADPTWQIAVYLPEDYLVTGRYSLDDPRIGVARCGDLAEDLGDTIDVREVTDAELIVRFESDDAEPAPPEQELRVARCP